MKGDDRVAPRRKFLKENIIQTAYEIVKEEGFESINARRIAKELNSSVQPIFHNFATMEELKKEVYEKVYQKYKEYMLRGVEKEKDYKQMGISYIQFAKDYPEFFKIIFMQKTNLNAEKFVMADAIGDDIIKKGQLLTGLPYEEQKKFHVKVWIFTHGIATLVATKTVEFTDLEISELLEKTVREMAIGYIREKKGGKKSESCH